MSIILHGTQRDDCGEYAYKATVHTLDDAIAVGWWLHDQSDICPTHITDEDGAVLMDPTVYAERVIQYGELVVREG